MSPDGFVRYLGNVRASAILRTDLPEAVEPAMSAAVRAGFCIIEFTLTTPNALDHIREFSRREGLVVGAGTVLNADEARAAVAAGARFLVSPVMDEAVIEAGIAAGAAMMPGCHTPTEMFRAHLAGAPLQKLFPAPGIGPRYVKACLGPMPFLRIVPTNGVDAENVVSYLESGAWAVGFVDSLFAAGELAAGRFEAVERRGRELLERVANASRPAGFTG